LKVERGKLKGSWRCPVPAWVTTLFFSYLTSFGYVTDEELFMSQMNKLTLKKSNI